MHPNPLISVIIPTLNRCELLRRAINSVVEQSYPHWEVLVVDNGSTDGTRRMLAELDEARIRFIEKAEGAGTGSGSGRYRGAAYAQGDYIAYLDSDDYWLPHKLERQLAAIADCPQQDVVVLSPPMVLRDEELFAVSQPRLQPGEHIAEYLYAGQQCTLQTSCFMVNRALGQRVRFDPDLRVNQDTDYLLRLAQAGGHFVYIDEHLHVQDINLRGDRISVKPQLIQESLAWFKKTSPTWPSNARRGFFLVDLSIRSASQGRIWQGLRFFFRGLDGQRSVYFTVHQFMRVLGRGDVPAPVRALMRGLRLGQKRRSLGGRAD